MRRSRILTLGCPLTIALAIALCLGFALVTSVTSGGALKSAQARWAAKGGKNYTLVVSQWCFCGVVGDYRITVQRGIVTAAEPIPGSDVGVDQRGLPPVSPSALGSLTVESMLQQADHAQGDAWLSPWTHQISISYDPTYGYVTSYRSDGNGYIAVLSGMVITDSVYEYTAHDLVLTGP